MSDRRNECFDLANENDWLREKVIWLETKIEALSDRESTLDSRIEYWRQLYTSQIAKYRKLQKVHYNCPKKSIFLYR